MNCGIEDIEEGAFETVADGLQELVLTNNSFKSIPNVGRLPKLLSLNLRYNKV